METYYERLASLLLEKNNSLSPEKARTWVELLWEDFETTRAKAGRDYQGKEVTERIVRQMIDAYGDKLHHFAALNPK
ncbi:YfhJ family protein [Metabacillus sp. RGM 3146]|uniref:YfhJ family protein n=1 Tax=Metabacillus sp. RGM 3146 TaxID=3401092 RepID=UPI003B98F9BF